MSCACPRFRIDDLPAPEEPAQSCQAQSVEQQFYRGLSVLISMNGPLDAAVLFKVCVRYSDTERRYNEYPVPATSARKSSNFQRDASRRSVQKIRFQKLSACPRTWLLPNRTMKCAGFSRKIICVFENVSRGSLYALIRSTLLSYPADFSYRANVLATSLDIS
jgi:hypothetical protein